jgi:hypothetical protein
VLLFTSEEYVHAKLTIVDHYSFKWNDAGSSFMALPLGLGETLEPYRFRSPLMFIPGAIFNHSREPNVSYRLDKHLKTIEFTTTKQILPGQELCDYYGSDDKLWFPLEGGDLPPTNLELSLEPTAETIWDHIVPLANDSSTTEGELLDQSVDAESMPEPNLFRRIKMLSVEELEELDGMPVPTSKF